jgi:hypothetical protein
VKVDQELKPLLLFFSSSTSTTSFIFYRQPFQRDDLEGNKREGFIFQVDGEVVSTRSKRKRKREGRRCEVQDKRGITQRQRG